jgi:hypothetical protein
MIILTLLSNAYYKFLNIPKKLFHFNHLPLSYREKMCDHIASFANLITYHNPFVTCKTVRLYTTVPVEFVSLYDFGIKYMVHRIFGYGAQQLGWKRHNS